MSRTLALIAIIGIIAVSPLQYYIARIKQWIGGHGTVVGLDCAGALQGHAGNLVAGTAHAKTISIRLLTRHTNKKKRKRKRKVDRVTREYDKEVDDFFLSASTHWLRTEFSLRCHSGRWPPNFISVEEQLPYK